MSLYSTLIRTLQLLLWISQLVRHGCCFCGGLDLGLYGDLEGNKGWTRRPRGRLSKLFVGFGGTRDCKEGWEETVFEAQCVVNR